MTPLEALAPIRRDAARVRFQLHMEGRLRPDTVPDPLPLALCNDCARALRLELAALFPQIEDRHKQSLNNSRVYGCTFSQGTPDQCALHDLLREDAVCRP